MRRRTIFTYLRVALGVIIVLGIAVDISINFRRQNCLDNDVKDIQRSLRPISTLTDRSNKLTSIPIDEKKCREILSQPQKGVFPADYNIQLLAAAPGSGSDWSALTISLLTGLEVSSVYNYPRPNIKTTQQLPNTSFYYKTHYPFMRGEPPIRTFINTNAKKVVLLVRNPLDAAFSEYVRRRTVRQRTGNKYGNVDKIFNQSDFLVFNSSQTDQLDIEPNLKKHFIKYFGDWTLLHNHWLTKYDGPLKVFRYKDLAQNIDLFGEILEFFGYNKDLTEERQMRFDCVTHSTASTERKKRPKVPVVDESREKIRLLYERETKAATSSIEQLYREKYKTEFSID